MGMYNEVFKKCPTCNSFACMQISEIVLGFGEFYLDDPESIAKKLDENEIQRLKEEVESSKWFYCEKCLNNFSINSNNSEESNQKKINIINSIGK